jgi:pyruvate formate lyase activating enzyme
VIRAIIETSLIDWDGKITMVLFFDRCNFVCPFCQNWDLIIHPSKYPVVKWEKISNILKEKKGWIDGVVLTGGEPLVDKKEVFNIIQKLKKFNVGVKVDTNGAYPNVLRELINKKLVDYIAMDVKAPIDERYYIATGKKVNLDNIEKSIRILMSDRVDYEFRTTCVPRIINEKTIHEIGSAIKGAKKWALQAFVSDNAYKEEYRQELKADYFSSLKKYKKIAQKYVDNIVLRGKV